MIVKTKEDLEHIWCPEVHMIVLNPESVEKRIMTNRGAIIDPKRDPSKYFCCIGPKCSAWNWNIAGYEGYCAKHNDQDEHKMRDCREFKQR